MSSKFGVHLRISILQNSSLNYWIILKSFYPKAEQFYYRTESLIPKTEQFGKIWMCKWAADLTFTWEAQFFWPYYLPLSMNPIPGPIGSDHRTKSDRNPGCGTTNGSDGKIIITPHFDYYSFNQYYGMQFYPTIR